MKLQYMSDIHLETYKHPFPLDPVAPNLALIGDICGAYHKNLIPFLERCAANYETVLFVPGNHEYYGHTLDAVEESLESLCAELGIEYLQCRTVEIDDVVISGCTLWCEPTVEAFERKNKRYWLKDYSRDQMIQEHQRHVEFLNRAQAKSHSHIFLTHYAPMVEMNGIYQDLPSVSMFATDLKRMFQAPLRYWLCGHVHQNLTLYENGIPCQTNCFGYPNEADVHASFDLQKCVEI